MCGHSEYLIRPKFNRMKERKQQRAMRVVMYQVDAVEHQFIIHDIQLFCFFFRLLFVISVSTLSQSMCLRSSVSGCKTRLS